MIKLFLYFNYRYPFDVKQSVVVPDWQLFIGDTAKQILSQQSPGKLLEVRSMLYELIVHGIPTNVIFKVSLIQLLKYLDVTYILIKMQFSVFTQRVGEKL